MKYLKCTAALFMAALLCAGCHGNKTAKGTTDKDSNSTATAKNSVDTTIYGKCGDGTAMHTLELVLDNGKTETFMMETEDSTTSVVGGLLVGDRMAVIAQKQDGDYFAKKVINITSLMGKWTSIDKNFAIKEGGTVESYVKAETHPYTSWKIFNGKLILSADTFDIVNLGADSLYLENTKGIYGYKRQK
jgi:hypothetical protein